MYILSSDYDGTLKTRIHDLYINIHEISKFRKLGNIFIINTGRAHDSIVKEIKKFNIPFDYLCCNDGTAIFDDKLDIIDQTLISSSQMHYIKALIPYFPGFKISNFYAPKKISRQGFDNPIEVQITKQSNQRFDDFLSLLENDMTELVGFPDKNHLYVRNNKASKSIALNKIASLFAIDPKTIYTVGDEDNDIEMIINHRGFRMLESSPNLWFKTWRVTPEVHHLVKYLNFKTKRSIK